MSRVHATAACDGDLQARMRRNQPPSQTPPVPSASWVTAFFANARPRALPQSTAFTVAGWNLEYGAGRMTGPCSGPDVFACAHSIFLYITQITTYSKRQAPWQAALYLK